MIPHPVYELKPLLKLNYLSVHANSSGKEFIGKEQKGGRSFNNSEGPDIIWTLLVRYLCPGKYNQKVRGY